MTFYNAQFCDLFSPTIATLKTMVASSSWQSDNLGERSQQAAANLHETTRLMLSVRQHVSSEIFSASRKYTQPIDIPGADWKTEDGRPTTKVTNIDADSNIAMLDFLLYGADDDQMRYLQQLYPYFPISRRLVFENLAHQGFSSVADRFVQERSGLPVSFQESVVEMFKQMWGWRSMHNSAITTHLRSRGKGQNPNGQGFEYDSKITRLLQRSKNGYEKVLGQSLPA